MCAGWAGTYIRIFFWWARTAKWLHFHPDLKWLHMMGGGCKLKGQG